MIKHNLATKVQRKLRARKRLLDRTGLSRLIVKRSNKHLHAQVIDSTGKVLAAASSLKLPKQPKSLMARQVGVKLAESLTKAKVGAAVLDRGQYRFHGRIKAFVEALRENKIKI